MTVSKEFLFALAAAAEQETLPRFRQNGRIENKLSAGFDPVTEADQAAELAIRRLIEKEFPDHGILGEEHGSVRLDSRHVWVIDPIDGTRAFHFRHSRLGHVNRAERGRHRQDRADDTAFHGRGVLCVGRRGVSPASR